MRRVALLACDVMTGLHASAADQDELLSRVPTRINEVIARAARYTCSLSITREYYLPTIRDSRGRDLPRPERSSRDN